MGGPAQLGFEEASIRSALSLKRDGRENTRFNHDPLARIRIYSIADIAKDPQFHARGMIREMDDPELGRIKVPWYRAAT